MINPMGVEKAPPRNDRMAADKVECNACPVLCQISDGRSGACDRYANVAGRLVRVDPVLFLSRGGGTPGVQAFGNADALAPPRVALHAPQPAGPRPDTVAADSVDVDGGAAGERSAHVDGGAAGEPCADTEADGGAAGEPGADTEADGGAGAGAPAPADLFVTGVGASTTYPDYKPAPFIVSSRHDGVDMVTVVTEAIFSYCSLKVKIDTDRWLGPEQAAVHYGGQAVGHVTTAEYGSQMLSLGGVHHLTGGSKQEGRATCDMMLALANKQAVEVRIADGASVVLQAARAPIVDGVEEKRMRVGCGSAAVGMFARQFYGAVDEVVVVDDHITGVLTEHQAGRCLSMPPSGIRLRGRKSTPGRYFQVARPGTGWGGTDIEDPLSIVAGFAAGVARPGLRLLMVSTTGEHSAYYILDDQLIPRPAPVPEGLRRTIDRIGENCEPSLTSVLFMAGAGGSLRAGATENPIQLTRAIKAGRINTTFAGAPAYVWPGGGITLMVDVARMPDNCFGMVPTPALVAPLEFTMRLDDYRALGGHMEYVRDIESILQRGAWHSEGAPRGMTVSGHAAGMNPWPLSRSPMIG